MEPGGDMSGDRRERVLVLGLGNTILSDDGVGVYAARRVRELLGPGEAIDVAEAELGGFALLDLLEGYRGCVILDAVEWPDLAPGELRALELEAFAPTVRLAAGHQIDLPTALELGRTLGLVMPGRVTIVAVGVEDPRLLGERCTEAVAAAIAPAADLALRLARAL
jgi:hydrogenase maturation protease